MADPKCSNFIYMRDGAFSDDLCDNMVKEFDRDIEYVKDGHGVSGIGKGDDQFDNKNLGRSDSQIFLPYRLGHVYREIMPLFFQELDNYKQAVSTAAEGAFVSEVAKMQKTEPTQGYHVWHHEQGVGDTANRALAWMVYLNDVEQGGETEFLYQAMRVEPKKGRAVIWPAGLTHPHRGNQPLSGCKYIVTGWFCYPPVYYQKDYSLEG